VTEHSTRKNPLAAHVSATKLLIAEQTLSADGAALLLIEE
jgi:hypothetical protein